MKRGVEVGAPECLSAVGGGSWEDEEAEEGVVHAPVSQERAHGPPGRYLHFNRIGHIYHDGNPHTV